MLRGAMSSSSPSRRPPAALLVVALLGVVWVLAVACNFCDSGQSPLVFGSNVYWTYVDSVAACPAGDSLLIGDTQHRHPSKLRLEVWYDDINCNPKAGVPPESLWVTWATASGNAAVNDQGIAGTKIFADDSTDACGHTRFTIPSLSGCGKLAVTLRISGRAIGIKTVVVRTVDVNATGRVDNNDLFQATCDVCYSGDLQSQYQTELAHEAPAHWHRNVLFGTPVRRTTVCGTCAPETFNTLGDDFSWSPIGKMLAVTIFDDSSNCAVNLIPSDPAVGNGTIPFSMPPKVRDYHNHDYSPQWSPLGGTIFWNRGDFYMMYKGIYGQNSDTTTRTVPIPTTLTTMTEMSLSPDGRTLLFTGNVLGEKLHLFTVPIDGDSPTPLTGDLGANQHYPQWSADGSMVAFQLGDGPGSSAGQPLVDTTLLVPIYLVQGSQFSVTLSATDPELDAITFSMSYTQSGMSLVGNTFSWTPPQSAVGKTLNVKFMATTPSGGSDSFIAQFTVHQTAPQFRTNHVSGSPLRVVSPNPLRSEFALAGDFRETGVRLVVYDLSGRRVISLWKPSGDDLTWDLRATTGDRVPRGIYFYRAEAGDRALQGKLVV